MAYDESLKSKGAIFVNEDCTGKQPHLRGHIDVTKEQIDKLIEMAKAGGEVRLQVAAWRKTAASGAKYMFLSTEAYMKEDAGTDGWQDEDGKEDNGGWGETAPPLTDAPAAVTPPVNDGFEDDIPF